MSAAFRQALSELVNPVVQVAIATAKGELTIKESASESKIDKLTVIGLPTNVTAFSLDHQPNGNSAHCFKQLSCYLNPANGTGINKGCDLVLVDADSKQVILIELKSDKPKATATAIQLKNSELYVRYLLSLLEQFYEQDVNSFDYKHIVVTSRRNGLAKRPVSDKNRRLEMQDNQSPYKLVSIEVQSRNIAKKSGLVHFGRLGG